MDESYCNCYHCGIVKHGPWGWGRSQKRWADHIREFPGKQEFPEVGNTVNGGSK